LQFNDELISFRGSTWFSYSITLLAMGVVLDTMHILIHQEWSICLIIGYFPY
jgi:hypothetical protein